MSRPLRGLLLGSIAVAFLYLLVHAREPLRLNVGDPWSDANVLSSINYVKSDGFLATSFTDILDVGPLTADSYRYIHYPPLSEIFYGAVGKYLGVSDIGTFRLFGLMFSALAMWLLFSYVRRLYDDRVAWIATTLFSTSLLWMMYADSIHQAPVMQCSGFLALWGLVRAIETRRRRHYAAAILGALACFFTSYDYYLFLPAAVLVTVYLKAGPPFARGNRHFVVLCGLGCALGIVAKSLCVIGAVGWHEFTADLYFQFIERSTSTHDRGFTSAIPTMLRRITLVFTPLAWITAAFHVVKAIRAPSLTAALRDTAVWMLLAALAFLYLFAQLAASQMLASQVLLPFYAIGSAVVLDRLLAGSRLRHRLALAWLVAAPLWSFYFLFTHPRSVLARDDVAKTNAYLAANDPNDFVQSNLMSIGHIQAAFQRHSWAALDANETSDATREMMRIFEITGADHVHQIIFTDPDSRFIDKALWPLVLSRKMWSVTGAPHMHRDKANQAIAEYDRRVLKNLWAVEAKKVLQLQNFAVYRVDRAAMMAMLGAQVPATRHIDFGNVASKQHEILGLNGPSLLKDGSAASLVGVMERCAAPRCKTVLTNLGLTTKHVEKRQLGQVMIRVDPVCDLRLTFTLAGTGYARFSINGFSTGPMLGASMTFTVPAKDLTRGVNVVELENLWPRASHVPLALSALDLAPACAAP
jgi:Dolichyl-phosphate-mannose-protein mannosyltransferase